MRLLLIAFLILSFTSSEKIHLLYTTLDPQSISAHLAFYRLFPESPEGKKALKEAWELLAKDVVQEAPPLSLLSESAISSLVTMVTKTEGIETVTLSAEELSMIDKLTKHLSHRNLKGHRALSEREVLSLPPEEVDLARGLLLAQAADLPELSDKLSSYEALIDLMALQILTRISLEDPPEKKIREINRFIFEEMGYRFPPHSVFVKNVDRYTYLPSVIDSRKGVCLGVSILYIALAQRLSLSLEAITPPGHIYVRYCKNDSTINIETTARGIHLDTEEYMGIEMRPFKPRSVKEVIGMAYVNEASVHWQNENYEKALACYTKAEPYLADDFLVKELKAYNHLFVGETEKGKALLQEIWEKCEDKEELSHATIIEDFLKGYVDGEGIRSGFLMVNEERETLQNKRKAIEQTLIRCPQFRAGYFFLAVTWLQLGRYKEALAVLQHYITLDPQDATAHYLLAQLNAMRLNYPAAWSHLHQAEALIPKRSPTLKQLRQALTMQSPE